MNTWKRLLNHGTYNATIMHELFEMTKSRRISDEMTTTHGIQHGNKLLKTYEICIRSDRGETFNIIQVNEFDELIKRKLKQILQRRYAQSESEAEGE